jgi:hypothetical protein
LSNSLLFRLARLPFPRHDLNHSKQADNRVEGVVALRESALNRSNQLQFEFETDGLRSF